MISESAAVPLKNTAALDEFRFSTTDFQSTDILWVKLLLQT
jgi:hypothetical protein